MTTRNKFRIDILDSGGSPVGSGALTTVMSVDFTKRLDRVGEAVFSFPAGDEKIQNIRPGRQFDIYDDIIGFIGRYIYKSMSINDINNQAIAVVSCWDILHELKLHVTGFGRDFAATAVETIVDTLVAEVTGWSTLTGTGLGTANLTLQGHSVMEAISELAERWSLHFRPAATVGKVLQFDALGLDVTSVRLINARGQDKPTNTSVAFVTNITETESDDQLYNRIVALGGGEGAGQITLENATGGLFSVASRTPSGSQPIFYIEDSASVTKHGLREQVIVFESIHPVANTVTAKQQAKDELYITAATLLVQQRGPRIEYAITVSGLRKDVLPGDKIRLVYRGKTDDNIYIDVDAFFWVLDISQSRDTSGNYSATMSLLNVDKRQLNDIDLIAGAVQAIRSQKLVIKPTAFRLSDTYTDSIQNGDGDYQDKNAEFTLTIDDTVTDITRVVLKWKTTQLFTYSAWPDHGSGGVTGVNNSGGDPHTHTLITGIQGIYQVVTSPNYPTDVSMEINGVNVDNHVDVDYILGGTGEWNPTGTNVALDVEMDITDFILNAAGGIYQTFDIVLIVNTARTRNVAVPFWSDDSPLNFTQGNAGIVEMKIIIQGVGMAIYKS